MAGKKRTPQSARKAPLTPRRVWPWLAIPALGLAFVASIGTIAEHWPQRFFPIRYVRIEGTIQYLDQSQLRHALLPALDRGYFSVDVGELEAAVRSFAWTDSVQVARLWPDTVVVDVSEHRPVARWGDSALVDARGVRFAPSNLEAFAELPMIAGPAGLESTLLAMLNDLNRELEATGLSVSALELSKRRAYSARLNTGLDVHFGRQEPIATLGVFLSRVPKLGSDSLARLQRVDLRYPNGFALVWKPPVLEPVVTTAPAG